jgi:hypothetical protein
VQILLVHSECILNCVTFAQVTSTVKTATFSCAGIGCPWMGPRERRTPQRNRSRMISSVLSTSGKAGKPETWAGSPSHSGMNFWSGTKIGRHKQQSEDTIF